MEPLCKKPICRRPKKELFNLGYIITVINRTYRKLKNLAIEKVSKLSALIGREKKSKNKEDLEVGLVLGSS